VTTPAVDAMKKNWRYYLGLALFFYSFLPISVVAILPFLGMSLAESGTFAVAFLVTAEVAFMASVALLGKEFLAALKRRIMAVFRRTHVLKPVSRTRHRIGVALFAASFLPYYVVLIDLLFFSQKEAEITFLAWAMVAGEIAFMVSLFLLGGVFWERLKHMFDWSGDQDFYSE
jgi:hypothetical protein